MSSSSRLPRILPLLSALVLTFASQTARAEGPLYLRLDLQLEPGVVHVRASQESYTTPGSSTATPGAGPFQALHLGLSPVISAAVGVRVLPDTALFLEGSFLAPGPLSRVGGSIPYTTIDSSVGFRGRLGVDQWLGEHLHLRGAAGVGTYGLAGGTALIGAPDNIYEPANEPGATLGASVGWTFGERRGFELGVGIETGYYRSKTSLMRAFSEVVPVTLALRLGYVFL